MSDKYREVGVNLEAGYESVRLIKGRVARTEVKGAVDFTGALGGMLDPSVLNMKEPVLVSGTGGVNTRLPVTFEMDKHDTVGIDAVVIYISDVLVQGTAPIFFLDCLTVGKSEPKKIGQLVKGVADDCMQAGCTLIDGETAEMPDMYDVKHYDIVGFCVGVVDKCNLLDGRKVEEGDVLTGLPGTGTHSDGFSLIRKVLLKDTKLDLHKEYKEIGNQKLGGVSLTPTEIYVKTIKHLLGEINIRGTSHVTGGGFYENVLRMLREGQGVTIDTTAYPHKPILDMITKYGNIPMDEMRNVLNVGIGFMMTVGRKGVNTVQSLLEEVHEESHVIGEVTDSGSVDVKQ